MKELVKKKLIDSAKPVAFRSIPDIRKQEAFKEKKAPPAPANYSSAPAQQEAKLIIEEPPASYQTQAKPTEQLPVQPALPKTPPPASGGAKLGMLQNIRQQFANKPTASNASIIPLSHEVLMEHWNQFAKDLKDNRNPAFQSFYMASLNIINDGCFEVITNNNLEQKFIEQERRVLSEYLQEKFNNRSLLFSIIVSENPNIQLEPVEKPLTTREQFIKIVEQYPLVLELKDKLKLGIE